MTTNNDNSEINNDKPLNNTDGEAHVPSPDERSEPSGGVEMPPPLRAGEVPPSLNIPATPQCNSSNDHVSQWYVVISSEQKGPFSRSELQGYMKSGQITLATLAWKEGFEKWVAIKDVPELADLELPPSVGVLAKKLHKVLNDQGQAAVQIASKKGQTFIKAAKDNEILKDAAALSRVGIAQAQNKLATATPDQRRKYAKIATIVVGFVLIVSWLLIGDRQAGEDWGKRQRDAVRNLLKVEGIEDPRNVLHFNSQQVTALMQELNRVNEEVYKDFPIPPVEIADSARTSIKSAKITQVASEKWSLYDIMEEDDFGNDYVEGWDLNHIELRISMMIVPNTKLERFKFITHYSLQAYDTKGHLVQTSKFDVPDVDLVTNQESLVHFTLKPENYQKIVIIATQ